MTHPVTRNRRVRQELELQVPLCSTGESCSESFSDLLNMFQLLSSLGFFVSTEVKLEEDPGLEADEDEVENKAEEVRRR